MLNLFLVNFCPDDRSSQTGPAVPILYTGKAVYAVIAPPQLKVTYTLITGGQCLSSGEAGESKALWSD